MGADVHAQMLESLPNPQLDVQKKASLIRANAPLKQQLANEEDTSLGYDARHGLWWVIYCRKRRWLTPIMWH